MNDTHNAEQESFEFKTLRLMVIAMRDHQRLFFATKDKTALRQAEALEKRVDQFLEKYRTKV